MNSSILRTLTAVFGSLVLATVAAARDEKPTRVVLFSGNHFSGERIELSAGDQIDDFRFQRFPSGRNANNKISSLLIEGDLEVTLFEFRNFEGESVTLRDSSPSLDRISLSTGAEDWGNNLSSVIVRERPSRPDRDGRSRGDSEHGKPGERNDDRDRYDSRNDRPNTGGGYDRDRRDNDREQDRAAREAARQRRETEAVVRRAYVDILGREADRNGLDTYVGIVEDRGWSEARLRQELMRSTEFKSVVVPREITAIYQEVLGRAPDAAGMRFYSDRVIRAKWSFTRVKDALMKSPEYKRRPRR